MKQGFAVLTLIVLLAPAAQAVDFAAPITLIDGTTPLRDQGDKGKIVTLGDVAQTALLSTFQDEPNLKGEDKIKRFSLATKIEGQRKDPVLTADDIALIKTLIGKAYNPLITGQAWKLLDPASVP
jgi:hypothetical protein